MNFLYFILFTDRQYTAALLPPVNERGKEEKWLV